MRRFPTAALALAFVVSPGAVAADERLVAFGDSITVGAGDSSGGGGYPARLAKLLTTGGNVVVVENRGLGSETTAAGLSRLGSLRGTVADSILIMEGVNDLFLDISMESTVANLVAMERKAKQRGFGKVYVATITPIAATTSELVPSDSVALSEKIREAAYANELPMPDPHQAFLDLPRRLSDYYIADAIHPDADGYDELAAIFADYLRGIDAQPPAYNFGVPRHGAEEVPSDSILYVVLFDPLAGIDLETATLLVDGAQVATTVSGDPQRGVLQAHPGALSGEFQLGVQVADRASPPNRRSESISRFRAVQARFLTGDVDQDGRVDGADLVLLGRAFGAKKGDARFDVRTDFDGNSRVDGLDLAQLAAGFGRSKS
jgi:lysophospholipase L1-like esterase